MESDKKWIIQICVSVKPSVAMETGVGSAILRMYEKARILDVGRQHGELNEEWERHDHTNVGT